MPSTYTSASSFLRRRRRRRRRRWRRRRRRRSSVSVENYIQQLLDLRTWHPSTPGKSCVLHESAISVAVS